MHFVVAVLKMAIPSGLALQDTVGNCISCQTVEERTEILKLISEHRNRHGFRRLWPATAVQQEELEITVSSASCICHWRAAVSAEGAADEAAQHRVLGLMWPMLPAWLCQEQDFLMCKHHLAWSSVHNWLPWLCWLLTAVLWHSLL